MEKNSNSENPISSDASVRTPCQSQLLHSCPQVFLSGCLHSHLQELPDQERAEGSSNTGMYYTAKTLQAAGCAPGRLPAGFPRFLLCRRRPQPGVPPARQEAALRAPGYSPAAPVCRPRHDPRVPLALEGPSRPRRRDPERRLLGEVAEQEPLPRHAERERLSRTPLGHGPGTRVARAAGGGRRAAQSSAVPRADETLWGSHRAAPEFRTCAVMRAHLRPSSTAAGWWRLAVRVPERPCGRKCAL
jgi:hypothetical protein